MACMLSAGRSSDLNEGNTPTGFTGVREARPPPTFIPHLFPQFFPPSTDRIFFSLSPPPPSQWVAGGPPPDADAPVARKALVLIKLVGQPLRHVDLLCAPISEFAFWQSGAFIHTLPWDRTSITLMCPLFFLNPPLTQGGLGPRSCVG